MADSQSLQRQGRVAFTYPDFGLYQLARLFTVMATEMQSVAVGWQVYEITKRPMDLGYVGLAQFLPTILLFLVAGHAADRFNRRNIVALCYAGLGLSSAILLLLTLNGSRSGMRSMRRSCWWESCDRSTAPPVRRWFRSSCPRNTFRTQWPGHRPSFRPL